MPDHIDDDALEEYAFGRMDLTLRSEIEGHLRSCVNCRDRLNDANEFISTIREAVHDMRLESQQRVLRWLRLCQN